MPGVITGEIERKWRARTVKGDQPLFLVWESPTYTQNRHWGNIKYKNWLIRIHTMCASVFLLWCPSLPSEFQAEVLARPHSNPRAPCWRCLAQPGTTGTLLCLYQLSKDEVLWEFTRHSQLWDHKWCRIRGDQDKQVKMHPGVHPGRRRCNLSGGKEKSGTNHWSLKSSCDSVALLLRASRGRPEGQLMGLDRLGLKLLIPGFSNTFY